MKMSPPSLSGSRKFPGFLTLPESKLATLLRKKSISDDYVVEPQPFARGKFAAVKKCVDRVTGKTYAGKFIRKRRRAVDVSHELIHEAAVLQAATAEGCPSIVGLIAVYDMPHEMALVLELANGGELQHLLDMEESFPEKTAIVILRQVLQGLFFLHRNNIAHLDVKPQNILLMGQDPHSHVKLCDFGISRVLSRGSEIREIMGTPDYVAPEILSYEPISLKSDIWSVGVLAYVLLTGCSPFGGETKQETYCNISQAKLDFPDELFSDVSQSARNFISTLLQLDPRSRPTAEECLHLPWLCSSSTPSIPNGELSSGFGEPRDRVPQHPGDARSCDRPSSPYILQPTGRERTCKKEDRGLGSLERVRRSPRLSPLGVGSLLC